MKYKTIKNFKNKLQDSDNDEFADLLFDFIKEEGKTAYDESVSQLQHALQTASLARTEDGRRHIVIASLLHDIGHLFIEENDAKKIKDLNHEIIASNFLKDFFSEKITESIRLHVVAKRYLCSIDISYYGIIYDLLDGIKEIIEGCLEPDIKEEVLGTAEVKDTFRSPKFGLIAGSMVIEGTIRINKFVRVLRDDIVVFEGRLDSLRRFKDEASEVATGTECGIGIDNYSDIKVGDKIEVFDKKEIRRTLD